MVISCVIRLRYIEFVFLQSLLSSNKQALEIIRTSVIKKPRIRYLIIDKNVKAHQWDVNSTWNYIIARIQFNQLHFSLLTQLTVINEENC